MNRESGHFGAGSRRGVRADDGRRSTRRKLVFAFGAGVFAAPLAAFAQQQAPKVARIAFLAATTAPAYAGQLGTLRTSLRELGYIEGKNLVIETRFAEGNYDRLLELAADLVRLNVDVIVTAGSNATHAAQKATTAIPIIITATTDPVGSGFVKSLARPGGNITGFSSSIGDTVNKNLEMLISIVPKLSRVAVLVNPVNSSHPRLLKSIQAAANKTGLTVLAVEAQSVPEIETAFSTMARQKAEAVIVTNDALFLQQGRVIADLALKHRLPSASRRAIVEVGGLLSYGAVGGYTYQRVAIYVDRILKGAKPADLPVEYPAKFELLINVRTAKALGLTVPQELLLRADKVIE